MFRNDYDYDEATSSINDALERGDESSSRFQLTLVTDTLRLTVKVAYDPAKIKDVTSHQRLIVDNFFKNSIQLNEADMELQRVKPFKKDR